MDEFTKTKIGFTLGLMAVVIALKPLIDDATGIGFILFGHLLTIKAAFYTMTALMGFSLYVMSFQFLSIGGRGVLDRISRNAYALSLITPVAYIFLWLVTSLVTVMSPWLDYIPAKLVGAAEGITCAMIIRYFAVYVIAALKQKDEDSRKNELDKKEFESLQRSESLIKDGHYDLSLLESFKLIEMSLREMIDKDRLSFKRRDLRSLVADASSMMIFAPDDLDAIDKLRVVRNRVTHESTAVTEEEAENALITAKNVLVRLDKAQTIASFNWLQLNRNEALQTLKENDPIKCKLVLNYLWDAWQNRDGAIWLEISEFFEIALLYNLQNIVEIFAENPKQFEQWLGEIDRQIFCDWRGDQTADIEQYQKDLLKVFDKYLAESHLDFHRKIVLKMYNKIKSLPIHQID